MKSLRESLTLTGARAISLLQQITKDGDTFVLQVKGPFSTALADTLRCRNQVYNLNDNPYPSLKSLALDHEISSCEMSIPTHASLQPTMVTGFTIKPSEAAEADGAMEVSFRLKFSTGRKELRALMDAVKDHPFDLGLVALQNNLFDAEPSTKTGDGAAGGTPIDMGEKQEPPVPLVQMTMDGEKGAVDEAIKSGELPKSRRKA